MAKILVSLVAATCCVAAAIGLVELLASLSGTSHSAIPQTFYSIFHDTQDVSGIVAMDKTGEYYEHEVELIFDDKTGAAHGADFSFTWDVVEGFDEDAVTFDAGGVKYKVGTPSDGWRRITVHCEGFDLSQSLTAKMRYSAEALEVSDTPYGYFKWDVDEYTDKAIPELDKEIASFENVYACANWINQNIEYESVDADPQEAWETYSSKMGDCDDIAVLFCYMVKRLFPEMEPRVVEGWTTGGRYHANAMIHTESGWLMLDPSAPSVKFGVFDFKPFAPSSRISEPFQITDEKGRTVENGSLSASFGNGTARSK
jgi:predicted transglutaminase-like cysteine proteinase